MPTSFPFTQYSFAITYGEVGMKTDISTGYGGKEYRDSLVSVTRRTFTFPLDMLSLAQVKQLWDFYVARKGAFESFNLTMRDENNAQVVYLVRFQKDGLTYEWFSAQLLRSGSITFIEDK